MILGWKQLVFSQRMVERQVCNSLKVNSRNKTANFMRNGKTPSATCYWHRHLKLKRSAHTLSHAESKSNHIWTEWSMVHFYLLSWLFYIFGLHTWSLENSLKIDFNGWTKAYEYWKYLHLWSEDEQWFYSFGMTCE